MPRTVSIAPRPYRNSQKPHLKWLVPVPVECQKAEGRKKAFFAVRIVAASFAERMRHDQERGRSLAFQLTESQRLEAAECIAALAPREKSLREATQFYLGHLDGAERSAKVCVVVKEFLAAKTAAGLSRAYLAPLSSRLKAFNADFGEQLASELTATALEEWLTAKAADLVTRNNIRRNIGTLFAFAVTRNYIPSNPVKHTTKAKEPQRAIEALTVNELRALLHTCDGVLLPLVAIGAFAGIRPEEITKLRWSNVDFDNSEIDVPAEASKTGTRRIVEIQPVLAA